MLEGSCLCGDVAYQADALAGSIVHCHCSTCRKAHGAAFATTAKVDRDAFRWTKGASTVAHFESSPGKLRHFCPHCGTHLMAEWVDQPAVILRLGSLDTGPDAQATAHIWVSHDVPWLEYGPGLPRLSEGRDSQPAG